MSAAGMGSAAEQPPPAAPSVVPVRGDDVGGRRPRSKAKRTAVADAAAPALRSDSSSSVAAAGAPLADKVKPKSPRQENIAAAKKELRRLKAEQQRLQTPGAEVDPSFNSPERIAKARAALAAAKNALGPVPTEQSPRSDVDKYARREKEILKLAGEINAIARDDLSQLTMKHVVVVLTAAEVTRLNWDNRWVTAKPYLIVLGGIFAVGGSLVLGLHMYTATAGMNWAIAATVVGGAAFATGAFRQIHEWRRYHPIESEMLRLKHRIDLHRHTDYGRKILNMPPEELAKYKGTSDPSDPAVQFSEDLKRLHYYAAIQVALADVKNAANAVKNSPSEGNREALIGKIAALKKLTGLDESPSTPAFPLDKATKTLLEKQIEEHGRLVW